MKRKYAIFFSNESTRLLQNQNNLFRIFPHTNKLAQFQEYLVYFARVISGQTDIHENPIES